MRPLFPYVIPSDDFLLQHSFQDTSFTAEPYCFATTLPKIRNTSLEKSAILSVDSSLFARGEDQTPVSEVGLESPIKSIGNSRLSSIMKKMECGLCAGRMNSIPHILFRKTDMLHIQRNDFCTGDILSLLARTERRQK